MGRKNRGRTLSQSILVATRSSSSFSTAWRVAGKSGQSSAGSLAMVGGPALEARALVAVFVPRLRREALGARVPVAEFKPWPTGTAHEAWVPDVETVPRLKGTTLEARGPDGDMGP